MSISKTLSYRLSEGTLDCSQMNGWDIVVADEAISSEEYAAEEFQKWFGQASGIELPLRTTAQGEADHVYIGPDAGALHYATPRLNLSGIGEEELQIVVESDHVIISGGRPRGTLYGVYQFLEDFFHVLFLTHDQTHVPEASAPRISCGTYTYNPPFSFRWSAYYENREHPEFAARLRVNTVTDDEKLGGKTQQTLINHSFRMLVPFDEYGADIPLPLTERQIFRKLGFEKGGQGVEPRSERW